MGPSQACHSPALGPSAAQPNPGGPGWNLWDHAGMSEAPGTRRHSSLPPGCANCILLCIIAVVMTDFTRVLTTLGNITPSSLGFFINKMGAMVTATSSSLGYENTTRFETIQDSCDKTCAQSHRQSPFLPAPQNQVRGAVNSL